MSERIVVSNDGKWKATFTLLDDTLDVEVRSKAEDDHLIPEIAVRKAFIEESMRRTGRVDWNAWKMGSVTEV